MSGKGLTKPESLQRAENAYRREVLRTGRVEGVRRGKGEGLHEARRKEEIGLDLERRRKKKNDRVGRVPTSFRPRLPCQDSGLRK